jgi:hypothetical protein
MKTFKVILVLILLTLVYIPGLILYAIEVTLEKIGKVCLYLTHVRKKVNQVRRYRRALYRPR